MKLGSQKPIICIHLFFVLTLTTELTLHRFLPQLLIQKVYVFRLQTEELLIHIKIHYPFSLTVLYLDERGATHNVIFKLTICYLKVTLK